MAIFKTGSIVGAISGTVGGANFANTRGSSVVRKPRRSSPLKSQSNKLHQSNVQRFSLAWRELTPGERDAWKTWANNRPRPNRLGVSRYLSGYQSFMGYHLFRANTRSDIVILPPQDFVSQGLKNFTMTSTIATGIRITYEQDVATTTRYAVMYGRPLYQTSIPAFNNSWKSLGRIKTTIFFFDITDEWADEFGAPIIDQVIAVRIIPVDITAYVPEAMIDIFAKTTAI